MGSAMTVGRPASEPDDEVSFATLAWRRLVRKLQRLRRLQRIWAYLGHHLQTFGVEVRARLRAIDQTPSAGKGGARNRRR